MTVIRKNLWFDIPPMKGEETPYQKPKVGQVSFVFKFQEPSKDFNFSPQINEFWKQILGPDSKIQFTDIFDKVTYCNNPGILMSAYSTNYQSEDQLALDLLQLVSAFNKILPAGKITAYLSDAKLDPKKFIKELQSPTAELFDSILILTHHVIKQVKEYSLQMEVISRTASALIPETLIQELPQRKYITTLAVLPLQMSDSRMVWIVIHRDSTFQLLDMNNNIPILDCDPNETNVTETDGVLLIGSSFSCSFMSEQARKIYTEANEQKGDLLLTFVKCFPEVVKYKDQLPQVFFDQFNRIIGATDFDFVRAFSKQASISGAAGRSANSQLLSILTNAGNITALTRFFFGIQIQHTISANVILRDSSPATLLFSTLSSYFGGSFADSVINSLLSPDVSLTDSVISLIHLLPLVPQQIKFMEAIVFRAARRKFPDGLVPLLAVGSMFMLRYLIPKLSTVSIEATQKGQKIMMAFVFHRSPDFSLTDEQYREIAESDLHITNYGSVSFPVEASKSTQVIESCAEWSKQLIDIISNRPAEHPLYWSVLELLENSFTGEEDLLTELTTHSLF